MVPYSNQLLACESSVLIIIPPSAEFAFFTVLTPKINHLDYIMSIDLKFISLPEFESTVVHTINSNLAIIITTHDLLLVDLE
jgi:hypothetical protein